jgi:hypothetical protein
MGDGLGCDGDAAMASFLVARARFRRPHRIEDHRQLEDEFRRRHADAWVAEFGWHPVSEVR